MQEYRCTYIRNDMASSNVQSKKLVIDTNETVWVELLEEKKKKKNTLVSFQKTQKRNSEMYYRNLTNRLKSLKISNRNPGTKEYIELAE